MSIIARPTLAILLLLEASCGKPNPSGDTTGDEGGPCFADGTCGPGLACVAGLCQAPAGADAEIADANPPPSDAEISDADPLDAAIDAEVADGGSDAETDAEPDAALPDADAALPDAEPPPPPDRTFRILSLSNSACDTVDLRYLAGGPNVGGDDHGILAHTPDRILSREYDAPWNNVDVGLRRMPDGRDSLVSDLGTATPYVFGMGGVPMDLDDGPAVLVDELIALDDEGGVTSDRIALSMPLALTTDDVSFFAGIGRIVVVTGGRIHDVSIPDGQVQDLGPLASLPSAQACVDGRYPSSGIVEHFDAGLHLVYKASPTEILRYSIATTATESVGTFDDIRVDCAVGFAPHLSRWTLAVTSTDGRPSPFGHCEGTFDTPGNPAPPTLETATPPSSISQTTTLIEGTGEPGSMVELYDRRTCRGALLGSGVVDALGRFAIQAVAGPRARTTFFGRSVRNDGATSYCSVVGPAFVHDDIRPTFGGAIAAQAFGPDVTVQWAFGADNLTPVEDLVYDVCVSTTSGGCSTFVPFATSAPGSSRAVIGGLTVGQPHFFVARVRDWAGIRDLNTAEVSATPDAAPRQTLRIDELRTTGCEISNSTPWASYEAVVSSSTAFVTGDPTTAFEIEDLQGGDRIHPYESGYAYLVSDLLSGTIYELRYGPDPAAFVDNPFFARPRPALVDGLLELDETTGRRTGRRINLSSPLQLRPGAMLFSGPGRILILDSERLVNVDLPSGAVTSLGTTLSFFSSALRPACYGNAAHGWVEDDAGQLRLIYIDGQDRFVRHDVATNVITPIPGAPMVAACAAGFSPLYRRWYFPIGIRRTTTITHCDAAYSQPPGNPFDAGFTPSTDAGTTSGPTCTNGSMNDCNPVGSTFTPFVDPSPPPGFTQCAGFTNTPGFDIETNWIDNCYPYRDGLLWIRLFSSSSGSIFSGARLTRSTCPGVPYVPDLFEGNVGFTDPGPACNQGGVTINWNSPGGYVCTTNVTFPGMIAGYRTNGSLLLAGSAGDSHENEVIVLPTTGGCTVQSRILRIAIYAAD